MSTYGSICKYVITYNGPKLPNYANTEKIRMNTDMVRKQYHKCYFDCRNILRLSCGRIEYVFRVILSACTHWSFYNLQVGLLLHIL